MRLLLLILLVTWITVDANDETVDLGFGNPAGSKQPFYPYNCYFSLFLIVYIGFFVFCLGKMIVARINKNNERQMRHEDLPLETIL